MDPLTVFGVSAWTGHISFIAGLLAIAGWGVYQVRSYLVARSASKKRE